MLAIRISQDFETRLQSLAHKTGRTKTYYAGRLSCASSKTWKMNTLPFQG